MLMMERGEVLGTGIEHATEVWDVVRVIDMVAMDEAMNIDVGACTLARRHVTETMQGCRSSGPRAWSTQFAISSAAQIWIR